MAEAYQFVAEVTSKAKQQNGAGWMLEVDWNLPGSRYPLHLYGQDWDDVADLNIGDKAEVSITRGGLKSGKSGQYESDYFWNHEVLQPTDAATTGPVQDTRSDGSPKPDNDTRIAWNSAINNAVHLHGPREQVDWEFIGTTAYELYGMITAGPGPTSIEPTEEPAETKERPKPDPVHMVSEALNDFNDGREVTEQISAPLLTAYIRDTYAPGEDFEGDWLSRMRWPERVKAMNVEEVPELAAAILAGDVS